MRQNYTSVLILLLLAFLSCKNDIKKHQFTNELVHETSPYLLQHAHNPVNWKAWNDTSLAQAKEENKLIVISVGYAACHWCHVMEKESFEDATVAKTMNEHFINIKVDREERPDVDKVYMKAVQLMTGNGGWPLNVLALPDGRPVFGGTYFSKNEWQNALQQISKNFKENPEKFYAFADKLEEGLQSIDLITLNTDAPDFTKKFMADEVKKWSQQFDHDFGGANGAPKFMLPNEYLFLMRYAHQNNDVKIMEYVENSLTKMAFGGIYDQVNGGFSRYATDTKWHIPHFEKMLYDNAQLVSLYAKAYQITKNNRYKNIVYETLEFIEKELTAPEGVFYSSLDADSYTSNNQLEEGAYYSWTKEELKSILKNEFVLFSSYYNINAYGAWEHDKYILIKSINDKLFSQENSISIAQLENKKKEWKKKLKQRQETRKKPRLDDKSLTSWNSLMISGYLDAYAIFNDKSYLKRAQTAANFIVKNQMTSKGKLFHNYKNGQVSINGYLEDYAATAKAFIQLYEITSHEMWLQKAEILTQYAITNFYNDASKMFYFTSKKEPSLVAKTIEYTDNVMASSNSIMAKNLFSLSHHLDRKTYKEMAISMLNNVKSEMVDNANSFSNWLDLMLNFTNPYYEVVISGKDAKTKLTALHKIYLPNILVSYSTSASDLPLLKNRFQKNNTFIYVCINKTCKLPVSEIHQTIKLIKK